MITKLAKGAGRRRGLAALAVALVWPQMASAEVDLPVPPAPPPEIAGLPVVLLVDMGAGRTLLARNAERRFLPASMTKVMTAYVAFEEMKHGKLRRDRLMTVREPTAREWSGKGTSMYLQAGERVSVDNLLHGIMTASANDASIVLAQGHAGSIKGWTFLMNDAGRRLGMTGSRFTSANGWPDGGQTYVTALDLVRLASAMIRDFPQEYARYSGRTAFKWRDRMLYSHDPVSGVVQGADGIKTGYTQEAGYNFLGSAQRDGRRLVIVTGGAMSEAQRAEASRALLEWGFAEWRARPLFRQGERIGMASVQGGTDSKVALAAGHPIYATMPRGENRPVKLTLRYDGPIRAPIAKGQAVATLEIRVDHMNVGRVPLVAAEAVDKGHAMDRLVNGFKNLLS